MPPSGYSNHQSKLLSEFLLSCADALRREATRDGLSLGAALQREIESIEAFLSDPAHSDSVKHVLGITQTFYERMREHDPGEVAEFGAIANALASQFQDEILGIHVPNVPAMANGGRRSKTI